MSKKSNKDNQQTNQLSLKRVVNVKSMRFKSNDNFEARPKQASDLHKLGSLRNYSFIDKMNKESASNSDNKPPATTITTTTASSTTSLLKQTSELDLGDNYSIEKTNPLFQPDEEHLSQLLISVHNTKINNNNSSNLESFYNDTYITNEAEISLKLLDEELNNYIDDKQLNKENSHQYNQSEYEYLKPDINTASSSTQVNNIYKKLSLDKKDYNNSKSILDQANLDETNMKEPNFTYVFKDKFNKKINLPVPNSNNNNNEINAGDLSDDDFLIDSNFDIKSAITDLSLFKIPERRNSDLSKEAANLKGEMNEECFELELKSTDLLYNLIVVRLFQKYWIAGCKNASPALGTKIHFGDEIFTINDYVISDMESFLLLSKYSIKPLIKLNLKRIPFARVILIQETDQINLQELILNQTASYNDLILNIFGIKLKANTAKIEKIFDSGLFYKNGLKYDPNKVEFDVSIDNNTNKLSSNTKIDEKDRLTKWVITEINGDLISYKCKAEEILVRLCHNDKCVVVVQPYDLVKGLYKEKSKFN